MKKALVLLLLLSSTLSACNLQQNGATAVRTPVPRASQPAQPTLADTPPPDSTAAPTLPPKPPPPTAPAPAASQAAPTQAAPSGAYPTSPVDVVQAFVEAYPDNIPELERYLSKAMRAAVPRGEPGELLKVQGDINGFTVLSGSVVPDPPQALVVAAMQAGGAQVERTFSLVQEKGLWVINGIQ